MNITKNQDGKIEKIRFEREIYRDAETRIKMFISWLTRNDENVDDFDDYTSSKEIERAIYGSQFVTMHCKKDYWYYNTNSSRIIKVYNNAIIVDLSENPSREFAAWIIHVMTDSARALEVIPEYKDRLEEIKDTLDFEVLKKWVRENRTRYIKKGKKR